MNKTTKSTNPLISPESIEAARNNFLRKGMAVTDWARSRGFSAPLVYGVLRGRISARRGQSYEIAVALGLIDQTEEPIKPKESA